MKKEIILPEPAKKGFLYRSMDSEREHNQLKGAFKKEYGISADILTFSWSPSDSWERRRRYSKSV